MSGTPFEPKFWLNKGDWITCNAVQMSKNRLRCAVKYKHFSPAMLYTTVTLYFLAYDWPQQSSFCSDTSHRLLCLKLHFSIAHRGVLQRIVDLVVAVQCTLHFFAPYRESQSLEACFFLDNLGYFRKKLSFKALRFGTWCEKVGCRVTSGPVSH